MTDPTIQVLSNQGYVPETCTLPPKMAFATVMSELKVGRSPCDRCNGDRSVCKGKPQKDEGEIMLEELWPR